MIAVFFGTCLNCAPVGECLTLLTLVLALPAGLPLRICLSFGKMTILCAPPGPGWLPRALTGRLYSG